jgi:hypothetical protein
MKLYTESTDGSSIETKESALVWHHRDADPGFGSSQAKELLDHLESVLANEPVAAKSGQYIVEVKPQVVILTSLQFFQFSTECKFLPTCWKLICTRIVTTILPIPIFTTAKSPKFHYWNSWEIHTTYFLRIFRKIFSYFIC